MPQGRYDARESGNFKIVNGKRVPLPTRSSNDTRASGERGPKGSRTYTRTDPTRGGMVDEYGVPFSMDTQGRPLSSIANDVARQRSTVQGLINQIPNVSRPSALNAWYGDVTSYDPVNPKPTARPWGKEGKSNHPDYRAQTARQGEREAGQQSSKLVGQARRAGITPRDSPDLATAMFEFGRVGQRLRDDARRYEQEYADKYLAHQTDRMRSMMNARKPKTEIDSEKADPQEFTYPPDERTRKPSKFDSPAPDSTHLDLAPSDAHRSNRYEIPVVATRENVARDLMEYAGRSLPSGKAPTKTAPSKGSSTARRAGSVAALAAGSFAAGQAGVRSVDTRSAAEKMRDDASDMGPVKGRVMERRTYQAAGGTRPQAEKIVPYAGQTKTSRLLGVSNVKAGQK